ncbi:MAG: serine hydrolase [Leptolyngbyaceae cyanobacterium]
MTIFKYLATVLAATLVEVIVPPIAIATVASHPPFATQSVTAIAQPEPTRLTTLSEQFIMSPAASNTIATNASLTAEMDAYLQAHYETGRFMGTAIVLQNGAAVFTQSYGMASLGHQVPNTPQTKFRIGSITKQFTAAAILQLQDRGQLDVQAPVSNYLPDYPQGDLITIHHLLTHTAGIPNLTSFPDYPEWMQQPTTLAELMARFQDLPLEFEPWEQYRYSNSGYVLLTQIIETVSGQAYADYLQEHLFIPLGLENTGYEQPLTVINGLANGYVFTGEDYQQAEYINMAVPAGAGGLYSTVGDLARWNQFLFEGDRPDGILSAAAIAAMTSPQAPIGAEAPDLFYGYGLIVNERREHRRIGHAGGINGFVSSLGGSPDLETTIAVLSNVANADAPGIAEGLAAILQGEPYELPSQPAAIALEPAVLARAVGTYQVTPEFQISITVEADHLQVQGTGQPAIPIYAVSETEFFARVIEFRLVFNTASDGTVESATLFQNGQELPAPKVD